MRRPRVWGTMALLVIGACGGDDPAGGGGEPLLCEGHVDADTLGTVRILQGQDQCAAPGAALPTAVMVRVVDGGGAPRPGVVVRWSVASGGGSLGADTAVTDSHGRATAQWSLGGTVGGQFLLVAADGAPDTARVHATAQGSFSILAGGNNVPDQCTSDLWVHGSHAYSGTWGNCEGVGAHVLKVWDVTSGVALDTTLTVGTGTVSDNEVSDDGSLLLVTSEAGTPETNGLYLYSLADPARPALVGFEAVARGLHTGTFAVIGGKRYVFAARNPHSPSVPAPAALMVYQIEPDSADPIIQVAAVTQPENYGIHDQFIRDGLAFVSDWNTGLRIYDVGDGRAAGSPAAPQLLGTVITAAAGLTCNCVHNSWWYHDADGGARYVFVGQEGPSNFINASGDIHVVDVSDMTAPHEVAWYHLAGAGVHNFWMDEARGILYAAYYNGGVVALDATGTLTGDLASREIARITPGGATNTFTWGVMLANGALYTSDMFSGFWKLSVP